MSCQQIGKNRIARLETKTKKLPSKFENNNSLHDVRFFKEELPVQPVCVLPEHLDRNLDLSVVGPVVKTFVDLSEGSAADALADLDVVPLDPVLVAAEHVLLKEARKMKND